MKRSLQVAASGIVLLAGACASFPLLLETDAARRTVVERVSALTGARVRYDSLALHWLPSPRVQLRDVAVEHDGKFDGRIANVDVRFALWPLLRGEFKVSAVHFLQPAFSIQVTAPAGSSDPLAIYRQAAGPVMAVLARDAADMALSFDAGRLDAYAGSQRMVSLSELTGTVTVSPDALDASVDCASDLWAGLKASVRIVAGTLAAKGSLRLTGLRAMEVPAQYTPGSAWRLHPGSIDTSLDVETDGMTRLRLTGSTHAQQFVVAHRQRAATLGTVRAQWEIERDGRAVNGILREVSVGELLHGASGTLGGTLDGARIEFAAKAGSLNLAELHKIAAAAAGEHGAAPAPMAYLPAGKLRDIEASGTWPGGISNASGRLERATVAIPAAGIVVQDGNGPFVLADSVLRGAGLTGGINRSTFSAGKLALELGPRMRLRSLEADLRAELGDVLAVARQLVPGGGGAGFARIASIAGRATGSVRYDVRRSADPISLQLANVDATVRHDGIPVPVRIARGSLQYSKDRLRLQNVTGTAGRSRISDGNLDFEFSPAATIRAASGDGELWLDELFPWLKSIDALPAAWVAGATGGARVRLSRLAGPPARPSALEFEALIEPRQLNLQMPALHAPLLLASGEIALTPRMAKLKEVALAAGATRAVVSGSVTDYAAAVPQADIELAQGVLDPDGLEWMRARWELPATVMPRAPLEIAAARLRWRDIEREPLIAQGKIRVGNAVSAEFDFTRRPGDLQLRRLALKDADSDFVAAVHWTPAALTLALDGTLDSQTLGRMFAQPPAVPGLLRGNLRAAIDLKEPQRSSAAGKVEGKGLDFAPWLGFPLLMERFSLDAQHRLLRVIDAGIVVAGQRMDVSGTATAGAQAWVLDGKLGAKALDVQRLLDDVARGVGADPVRRASSLPWNLPVSGRLTVEAGELMWGRHVLQQVAGSLDLAANRIGLTAGRALYCGASAPFTAALTPGHIEARATFQARAKPVAATLHCLTPDAPTMTGTYDIDAELSTSGAAHELRDAARGTFRLAVRDGRIVHSTMLERTLTVEEVAARMQSDAATAAGAGFDYNLVVLAGEVEKGRARLEKSVIDGASLYMTIAGEVIFADGSLNLQGLLAPLRGTGKGGQPPSGTFGRSVVVVPVGIRGTVTDPKVTVMPAGAVARTLVNVITARFLLPVNMLDGVRGGTEFAP